MQSKNAEEEDFVNLLNWFGEGTVYSNFKKRNQFVRSPQPKFCHVWCEISLGQKFQGTDDGAPKPVCDPKG